MTITYRTTGAWGVGTGFDLPAATIDANFWDLHGRIDILEAWPTPAAIESFTIDGNQMTVVMDDATTHGPYTLPTYVPSAFVWAPGMDVVPGQMFSMGATIYTVVTPHTTVDPFDANETSTDGDYYQEFVTVDGVLPAGGATGQALVKSSSADYAVTWSDAGGVPAGGTTGQVLKKQSGTDFDADWSDLDLDSLSDVVITSAAQSHVLVFDEDTDGGSWVNREISLNLDIGGTLQITQGGTGATSASQARDLLGLEIGADVQAYDQQLSSLVRQNSKSADYTLVLADSGYHILHPTADNNPRTFTIPANSSVAYPIGTAISFVNEINTVTIAITTDTMVLAGAGTTGSRTLAANGMATALKITSTKWFISGSGLT